jgi:hypothetical protein
MPRRHQPEAQLQRAVVDHLAWRARPGVWFTHPANGGWRSKVEAAIFKAIGVRKGCPDLLLAYRGAMFALELKAERGRLTPDQQACHADLERAGVPVATAHRIDEALAVLEAWQLLRPARSA